MAKRINDITTIKGLNAQMRSVYRLARINTPDDEITPQDAKILVDILKTITATQHISEFEDRLKEMENERNADD